MKGVICVRKFKLNPRAVAAIMAGGIVFSACSMRKEVKSEVYADQIQPKDSIEYCLDEVSEETINNEELYETEEELYIEEKPYQYIPAVEATTGLNVRTGPSTDYDVIGGMTTGARLPYKAHDLGWYQIDYYGREAYVCGDYVNETSIITGTPKKIMYCNQDTLLTDEYGVNHDLPRNELCLVYDEYPDAYLVAANNQLGIAPKVCLTELEGTFAVVDISDQRVDIYKDNELLLSTPCVTGKDTTPTTEGCHTIHSEKHHDYLIGPGYKSYVDHFLAFHNGEGLHDASWRSVFGNDGYHESGSHGCVNLPQEVIEDVNNILDTNDTVLVKH